MNTVVFYTLSACAGGSCPSTVVQAAPVQPVPVVIYQADPRPIFPIFRPQVIYVVR